MARLLTLHSPSISFGDSAYIAALTVNEGLSELFELQFDVKSPKSTVDLKAALGKEIAAELEVDGHKTRFWHGRVASIKQTPDEGGRGWTYHVRAVPWLWILTRRADSRIFSKMSAVAIVKQIFSDAGFSHYDVRSLKSSYQTREYTVQYRETDFNFVSRLLEDEGIYYYFRHTKQSHTLVLVDGVSGHEAAPGYEMIPYLGVESGSGIVEEYLWEWDSAQEVASAKYELRDFDYSSPGSPIKATQTAETDFKDLVIYDYPGTPAWNGEALDARDLGVRTKVRLQELQAAAMRVHCRGNARGVATGSLFKPESKYSGLKHPRQDQNVEHLVVSSHHVLSEEDDTSGGEGEFNYEVDFECIPSSLQFRPPRVTRKPFMQGPQTATVVGPDGEEIYVDDEGRIQVKFHWAHGSIGSDSDWTCFLRVAQVWAGNGYGAWVLPRVGHEVVVSFLDGDPDRPLVTGSVYNGNNKLPYGQPDNKTQSGFRTRSADKGGTDDCNEFLFEDKKGEEFVKLHAQKDLTIEVENDEKRTVDKNRISEVKENDTETVGKDQTIEVKAKQSLKVVDDQATEIQGAQTVKVMKNQTVTVQQKYKLTATQEIAFECGASKITMKPDGTISIEGVQIKITGSALVDVHSDAQAKFSGLIVQISADTQAEVKGLMLNLSGDAMAQLKGAITMIG